MNETSAVPGASLVPESTGLITWIHFVLIALFALAAVAIILVGIVRRRRRKDAEQAIVNRVAEEAPAPAPTSPVPTPPIAPAPAPLATPPASELVAEPSAPEPMADEPIAAAAPAEANPAVEAASAGADGPADDPADGPVTQLKGLGPKVAARLAELGITTVGQLARLDDLAAERLDAQLGPFTGRLRRDRWLEQARLLAAGNRAGFEAVFGRL